MEVPVAEFLAEKQRRKAARTHEQYRTVLETVWLPWCASGGISYPTEVTDVVMDRFVDYLRAKTTLRNKPLSIPTIRTYVRVVRIFLNWCSVPKGRFEMPAQPKRVVRTLTRQEIDLLERVADTERDKLIVRVLADTGVRVSELVGLTVGDLRGNNSERRYTIQVIGKGDKEREVVVPAPVYKRLRALVTGGGFIFRNQRMVRGELVMLRTPLDRHQVGKIIRALGLKAGMVRERRVRPHLFRHSYATQQVKTMKTTGVSLIDIQRQMGWSSLAMLTQVYSHTVPADSYDALIAGLK